MPTMTDDDDGRHCRGICMHVARPVSDSCALGPHKSLQNSEALDIPYSSILLKQLLRSSDIHYSARRPNLGFSFERALTVFTRSGITLPKVNRYGQNLAHSEYTVRGWPWQILAAIHAVATAGEPGEMLFFCQVSNERFTDFPSAKFHEI